MFRNFDKIKTRICRICGDTASGINFNALTCFSCKAFFRRNALRDNKLSCNFTNECVIERCTRKVCAKCRLNKCFQFGMKKEWILNDEEKSLLKEKKITKSKLRRQKLEENPEIHEQESSNLMKLMSSDDVKILLKQKIMQKHDNRLKAVESHKQENDDDKYELNSVLGDYCDKILSKNDDSLSSIDLNFSENDDDNESLVGSEQVFPICREINPLPTLELLQPELQLLSNLNFACSVLNNPYTRIRHFFDVYSSPAVRISDHSFARLSQMCSRLCSFQQFSLVFQQKLIQTSLVQLLSLRSPLMHNPEKQCWYFMDDQNQVSIMIPLKFFQPFCTNQSFERHCAYPRLFRDEWKQDRMIFDLLTVMALFTAKPDYSQEEADQLSQEYSRYSRLLHRYLTMKYSNVPTEVEQSYSQLLTNLHEIQLLNVDVVNFFQNYKPDNASVASNVRKALGMGTN